jgi:5-methylcytosine-specific restriction endonuclease McrA
MNTPMIGTLVLAPDDVPLTIIPWRRAIALLAQAKAERLAASEEVYRSELEDVPLPLVVRLVDWPAGVHRRPQPSRANVFARDRFMCQFCGETQRPDDLKVERLDATFPSHWNNVVSACTTCVRDRRARALVPIRRPTAPRERPPVAMTLRGRNVPPAWLPYLGRT